MDRGDRPLLRRLLGAADRERAWAGRRRIGTDHRRSALVGASDAAASALAASAGQARAASACLDRAAPCALAIAMPEPQASAPRRDRGRMLPLTSGARVALASAVERARPTRAGLAEAAPEALRALSPADPGAALADALAVDRAAVRARRRPGNGGAA